MKRILTLSLVIPTALPRIAAGVCNVECPFLAVCSDAYARPVCSRLP
jgi:hypothetical protein